MTVSNLPAPGHMSAHLCSPVNASVSGLEIGLNGCRLGFNVAESRLTIRHYCRREFIFYRHHMSGLILDQFGIGEVGGSPTPLGFRTLKRV